MDIERIRYSIARYLRSRILKIQHMVEYIMSDLDIMDRLSADEKEFARKLHDLVSKHVDKSVFSRLDEELRESIGLEKDRVEHAKPKFQVSYV